MSVSQELAGLQSDIAAAVGGPNVILYDGRFAAADIKKISFKKAAVFISCARTVPSAKNFGVAEQPRTLGAAPAPATVWQQRADFAAAVVTDKNNNPPQQAAWRLAETIIPPLYRRAAQNVQISNAYTDDLWQIGMFMLVITWSKQLQVAVPAAAEPAAAEPAAAMAPAATGNFCIEVA